MSRIEHLPRQDWEELATLDPLWAILSDDSRKFDGWQQRDFFDTGASEIATLMKVGAELGYPKNFDRALDFGCGVGRLTRALGEHFVSCIGVDISSRMIAIARELNPDCEFEMLDREQLQTFP